MAFAGEDFSNIRPPPPPNLSKENVGIWVGWSRKGDREVAREAAAKGIAVDLVVLFLSQRKKIRLEEAENFFRDEVFVWAKELLDRKQIFRVSHILTNIGVNPQEEMSKVFYTSTNIELREYIGNHLTNQKKLDENYKQLWHFLDVILRNNLLISKWKLSENSIECLNKQEPEWKSEIASKLFLRTHDILLLPFLTGEALWRQLLIYNDTKLLKTWINIYFGHSVENFDIPENLSKVFKMFSITSEMINQLNSFDTSANTCNVILNDLSRFGVFCNRDAENFLNILYRLYQSNNIPNIFQIIKKSTSNISEKQFLSLLVDYCLKNNLHTVLSACIEKFDIFDEQIEGNKHLKLILDFRKLTQDFSEENLKNNVLHVSQFLSDNLEEYFSKNPFILLSLIFFTENADMESILKTKCFHINDVNLKESIENLPKQLKTLNALINRKTIIENSEITFYTLLEKHYKINAKKLFSFRFENKPLPDFGNQELIQKFGYQKKINYLFYVKQFRPSVACKLFLLNQYENYKGFSEGSMKQLQKKIFKIVLRDFTNLEIVSSCTAFMEMIGIKSNFLTVAVRAAGILLDSGISREEIVNMFLDIETNPNKIVNLLEPCVIKNIEFDRFSDGSYFVEAIRQYDIVVNFTIFYEVKLPELFLRSCATNNMWLPFLIFAQLNNYPIDQIKPLLQSFKNPNLLEHVSHSVIHDIQIDDQNVLMRERDSRNYFLSRIGVRKSLENLNQSDSVCSLPSQSSCGSNNSSTGSSEFLEIDISNTKATLLQTLIRCHNSTDPPRALLQACQLYKNPLLAILATSYEFKIVVADIVWPRCPCAIQRAIQRFKETGNYTRMPGSGRSMATSTRNDRLLVSSCLRNRHKLQLKDLRNFFDDLMKPDSVVTNWLTWLAVSCGLYEMFTNFESIALNSMAVTELLNNSVKNNFRRTLLQSFEIFLPTNSLRHFIEFLNMCIDLVYDVSILTTKLEAFKTSIGKCRRFSVMPENDHELTYLTNKIWIETTALFLLSSTIEFNARSLFEQVQLLELFCKLNIQNYIDCPDLNILLEIMKIVYDSKSKVKFNISSFFNDKNRERSVVDCMNALLDNNLFEHAAQIANTHNISLDDILVQKWKYNFHNRDSNEADFWLNCNEEFENQKVLPETVVGFFLGYVEASETNIEKYQLLKLAHYWSKKYDLASKYDIEKRKWLAYSLLEEKWRTTWSCIKDYARPSLLFKEMIEMLARIPKFEGEVSTEALNSLKGIINDALNCSNIWLALKLEKMFGCSDTNLEILKLCHSLAEGLLLPYQLNTEQRLLITNGTRFRRFSHRRFLSSRVSGSTSHSPASVSYLQPSDSVDAPVQDTLAVLCSLAEKVTSGAEMANSLFMMYRISINIEIPYHLVVSNSDSMKMLKDALEDDCFNKLEVVHDFFSVYKWNKEQIADFVCEEIINSATRFVKSKSDQFLMWDLKMDQDFQLVLQLLQDNSTLLGHKIYSYASAMHKSQVLAKLDFRISELVLVIELIIISHDCFTADCNMEGISIILKKCQSIIAHLLTLRSWKLIVRLLTGVGRYTEMNYVFQILRENDQFEFLLRKGSRKDNGLKSALLEYLKKYCPDNRELYKIVALHFTLFSEVAMLWEREAQGNIKNLIAISRLEMQNNKLNPDTEPFVLLSNNDGTKLCLNKAIENFTHATEFHLQGEKLAKAMHSAKQAELIALQVSLLKGLPNNGTAVCLLNLDQAQILGVIYNHLTFDQTFIMVQSYNYQPDWSAVLFEHCIVKNDHIYLKSYMKHRPLTESLVNDISRKFLSANINTAQEMSSMKGILSKLPSVHTKYRIASELGFTDIVEDLIRGGQLAYLKDTVWKKGYKD